MRCSVYKSLDKPSAFFGIRGRFMSWMAVMLVASGVVALFVGVLTVKFIGFLTFAVGAGVSYAFILKFQGQSSDRAFAMKMNSKKYARYVRTPAGAFRHMWRGDR